MHDRLYLRGSVWWCSYYLPTGKRVQESTKCTDRKAAALVLQRREREAEGAPNSYVSVGDVLQTLEEFTALNSGPENQSFVKCKVNALRKHLDVHADVHKLTRRELTEYIKKRLQDRKGPKTTKTVARYTVKREVKVFLQAVMRANKEGLTNVNVEVLRVDFEAPYVPRKRWLSREEFEELLEHLEDKRGLWVLLACYTGGRHSELEALTAAHIRGDMIHIPGTKTAKSDRSVPYHPRLKEAFGGIKHGPLVAPWEKAERDLKVACKALGIDPVTPNDLRRTYASWLLQAGVSNSVVAELLGHTTTELVDMTYGKLSQDALSKAVALI